MRTSDGTAGENCFQASDFANFRSALRARRGLAQADATATHGLVGDLFSRTVNAGRGLKEDSHRVRISVAGFNKRRCDD